MTSKTKSAPVAQAPIIDSSIQVHGARVHNLKNVTVSFPRNKLIVVTGVSGSGKSSLTIDTLFAEGQRRYAESLSAYARQFMARMVKPDVDYIKGLCPAIAIEQKVITRTPRSTVGSMTEIYDYMRLLYARAGKTISPISGREVQKDEVADVVAHIKGLAEGTKMVILVPFKQHANRQTKEELQILMQKGFARMYLRASSPKETASILRIEELLEKSDKELDKLAGKGKKEKVLFTLIDRLVVKEFDEDDEHRLSDSVGTGFYEGEGEVYIEVDGNELLHFSNKFELDGIHEGASFADMVALKGKPDIGDQSRPSSACRPSCSVARASRLASS